MGFYSPFLELDLASAAERFLNLAALRAGEFAQWLHDWQSLVAGILALLAAKLWGDAVIKATKLQLRAAAAAAPPAASPPAHASKGRRKSRPDLRDLRGIAASTREAPLNAAQDALERLRGAIRAVLYRVTPAEEALPEAQILQCVDIGKKFLGDKAINIPGMEGEIETLTATLISLAKLPSASSSKAVWNSLIEVNNAARTLAQKLQEASAIHIADLNNR